MLRNLGRWGGDVKEISILGNNSEILLYTVSNVQCISTCIAAIKGLLSDSIVQRKSYDILYSPNEIWPEQFEFRMHHVLKVYREGCWYILTLQFAIALELCISFVYLQTIAFATCGWNRWSSKIMPIWYYLAARAINVVNEGNRLWLVIDGVAGVGVVDVVMFVSALKMALCSR